ISMSQFFELPNSTQMGKRKGKGFAQRSHDKIKNSNDQNRG
ncbi:26356_t:CDS:1, partial [Racocetra persica]